MTRTHSAKTLALTLCALLLMPPVQAIPPGPARWEHEVHWFLDGDRALRLEISRLHSARGLKTIGAVLYEALAESVPPVSPAGTGEAAGPRSSAHVAPLSLPTPPVATAGVVWRKVIEWTASYDSWKASSRYRVGADLLEVRFPRDRLDGEQEIAPGGVRVPIEVEVNGFTVALDPVTPLDDVGVGRHSPRLPPGNLFEPLHDPDGFSNAWSELHAVLGSVATTKLSTLGPPDKGPCTGRCLACAGGMLGTLGSSIALIAACGGALVTGGSTAVACLVAFLAHESAMLSTSAACGICGSCSSNNGHHGVRNSRPDHECCPCVGWPDCLCPPTCTIDGA